MLKGQTTIGRFSARCPAGTEPIVARLRLARLFGAAELAPPGFPPRAVLVIRSLKSERGVPLGGRLLLRPESEREMREQVSQLWRRAARPVGGRVPQWAEAVLFEDEGEWLASLGLSVTRGEAATHWCFRPALGAEAAADARASLVRAWGVSPRFIPAALVRLARWGEAARFLQALGEEAAGALLEALRSEFDLPRAPALPRVRDARETHARDATFGTTRRDETEEAAREGARRAQTSDATPDDGHDRRRGERAERDPQDKVSMPAPWARWLAPAGGERARLPPSAARLLAYASALFHEPTLARRADFASEVEAFVERDVEPPRPRRVTTREDTPRPRPRASEADAPGTRATKETPDNVEPTRAADEHSAAGTKHDEAPPPSRVGRVAPDAETAAPFTTRAELTEPPVEVSAHELSDEDAADADERVAPWGRLEGCETRLGGVPFLLNLLRGLRLPECFDEDYRLSEHITGWGLTELLARSLLGGACAEYEDDPLWGALARLDGRAHSEPPAPGLRVGDTYRAPARWLNLFASRDGEDKAAMSSGAEPFETFEDLRAYGGARLPADLRRWMSWTFPFVKYALSRSLAEPGEGRAEDGAVAELLIRRGRLYCTATHVDLVLEAAAVSFAARRSGLDASLGWVRDLMRVVAFHFE